MCSLAGKIIEGSSAFKKERFQWKTFILDILHPKKKKEILVSLLFSDPPSPLSAITSFPLSVPFSFSFTASSTFSPDRQAGLLYPCKSCIINWPALATYASGVRRRADAHSQMHVCDHACFRVHQDIIFSFLYFFFTCCCFCLQHSYIPSDPAAHVKGSPGRFPSGAFPLPQPTPVHTASRRLCFCLHGFCFMPTPNMCACACTHMHACLRDCGLFFKHCVCVSMRLRSGRSFVTDVCDLFH